jgi:ribA/ribD-fused uncharacterized protein
VSENNTSIVQERFTLFWDGPFSQWYSSEFIVNDLKFNCAEQFMMYGKALLFHDAETAAKILQAESPQEQKALGRKIRNFDTNIWLLFREGVVYTASHAKFTQNPALEEILLATKGTTLVEASPYDKIWGIGLGENDPKASSRATWDGLNLLGETLTRVREAIAYRKSGIVKRESGIGR